MDALTLQLPETWKFSDEEFTQLASANQDLRLELTANRELIIMSPTGGETGKKNLELCGQIWFWNRQRNLGKAFDSSTGFRLPNGATRSPDVSWLSIDRWNSLSVEQRERFLPLCPDFVIELRSPTDNLTKVQAKMQEYIDNGLRLGWLINPQDRQVEIYQPNQPKQILQSPTHLSGGEVLPGFVLDLQSI